MMTTMMTDMMMMTMIIMTTIMIRPEPKHDSWWYKLPCNRDRAVLREYIWKLMSHTYPYLTQPTQTKLDHSNALHLLASKHMVHVIGGTRPT